MLDQSFPWVRRSARRPGPMRWRRSTACASRWTSPSSARLVRDCAALRNVVSGLALLSTRCYDGALPLLCCRKILGFRSVCIKAPHACAPGDQHHCHRRAYVRQSAAAPFHSSPEWQRITLQMSSSPITASPLPSAGTDKGNIMQKLTEQNCCLEFEVEWEVRRRKPC